jgi:hypothetical protein
MTDDQRSPTPIAKLFVYAYLLLGLAVILNIVLVRCTASVLEEVKEKVTALLDL